MVTQPYLANVESPSNPFVLGFLGPVGCGVGCGLERRFCCNGQHSYAIHLGIFLAFVMAGAVSWLREKRNSRRKGSN